MASKFKVILAGATGATGKLVLKRLLEADHVEKVTTIGRRELEIDNPKLEQKIVNFDELPSDICSDHDVAICTLGTTRGKSGKDGFIKVDKTYILEFAERCKDAGVKQFHLMSSQGANANSMFLYTQVKGEVDNTVLEMGFESAIVYRPAVLLVEREEYRSLEVIVRPLLGKLDFNRNWSIKSDDVAKVMVFNIKNIPEKNILQNTEIYALAQTITA